MGNFGGADALRLGANASVGVEEPGDGGRELLREEVDCIRSVGSWSKGEAPMFKHAVRVVMGVGRGLDMEVAEHGVGAPLAQELDSVGVGSGTEEGGRRRPPGGCRWRVIEVLCRWRIPCGRRHGAGHW